ncbi:MAG: hypothetical protein JWO99_568 [Candidatus Saccharibacteria bacterium]|nr:hypothetical protein [Candidatus Saccharibacteria bacterium]
MGKHESDAPADITSEAQAALDAASKVTPVTDAQRDAIRIKGD